MPLPPEHRATLSTIAKALRNVPREAIHDPPELFVWLNRQAKALERARDTPMPAPTSPQVSPRPSDPTPGLSSPPTVLSARERAEAVFDSVTRPTATDAAIWPTGAALLQHRMIVDRQGRGVRVEVRASRACGDLFDGPYA